MTCAKTAIPIVYDGVTRCLAAILLCSAAIAGARDIRVGVKGAGIATLPLDSYIAGVLSAEAGVFTSGEALRAMAVAARTFAVAHMGRHKSEGFDLCSTTHCQAYRRDGRVDALLRAVADTEDELLWHGGRVALAHYHRHCGGMTADARELWPDLRAPYLKQQTDTFCIAGGSAQWQRELPKEQLRSVEIVRRTSSDRVAEIAIGGRRFTAEQFHKRIGDAYGWAIVRSNNYRVIERPGGFLFQGAGFGHGVGLCQAGAEARGKSGQSYRDILAFYYPGASIGVNAQGFDWRRGAGESVDVYASTDAEVSELARIGDRALRDARQLLGLNAPVHARIRAYPSVAAFRDATGDPGWVMASTRGATVRMQPLGLVRSRGGLQATLLHEMLHVLVETQGDRALPAWFREGVVLNVLSEQPGRAAANEHERAHRRAYADALARVRKLVAAYGRGAVLRWIVSGLPKDLLAGHDSR